MTSKVRVINFVKNKNWVEFSLKFGSVHGGQENVKIRAK